MLSISLYYLFGINLITFAAFGLDKRNSINKGWRISEKKLLLFCAMGGSIGGFLGARIFRHKTRKQPFITLFYMVLVAQILLWIIFKNSLLLTS